MKTVEEELVLRMQAAGFPREVGAMVVGYCGRIEDELAALIERFGVWQLEFHRRLPPWVSKRGLWNEYADTDAPSCVHLEVGVEPHHVSRCAALSALTVSEVKEVDPMLRTRECPAGPKMDVQPEPRSEMSASILVRNLIDAAHAFELIDSATSRRALAACKSPLRPRQPTKPMIDTTPTVVARQQPPKTKRELARAARVAVAAEQTFNMAIPATVLSACTSFSVDPHAIPVLDLPANRVAVSKLSGRQTAKRFGEFRRDFRAIAFVQWVADLQAVLTYGAQTSQLRLHCALIGRQKVAPDEKSAFNICIHPGPRLKTAPSNPCLLHIHLFAEREECGGC
jgi:hypothetical protein